MGIGAVLRNVLLCFVLYAAACHSLSAQTFDVAEVRVNVGGGDQSSVDLANGQFRAHNVPLRPLIAEAWTTTPDGVIGPAWLDTGRVDIAAKASSAQTTDADLRLMLQALFKDRMQLVSHIEPRRQRVFALSIWKGQPKLTASTMPRTAEEGDCNVTSSANGLHAACQHMTMERLAHELPEIAPRFVDQRVVDQTRLNGAWDFTLDWTAASEDATGGLTLFAALQAQLGLQLKIATLPVPVLVIDSMSRTSTGDK